MEIVVNLCFIQLYSKGNISWYQLERRLDVLYNHCGGPKFFNDTFIVQVKRNEMVMMHRELENMGVEEVA
jgi:hypothetical protein